MIIPIGHEHQVVRRTPWVTLSLIAACILIHLLTLNQMGRLQREILEPSQKMVDFFASHPYLELDSEINELLFPTKESETRFNDLLEKMKLSTPEDEVLAEEQAEMDALSEEVLTIMDRIPFRRWGLIPSHKQGLTLISYMFLHTGWLHLIGNLLLLFLTGPFIEDLWGRWLYLLFYLAGGMVAALVYAGRFPDSAIPLIGASGAVSACMGAFLVRYFRTRIKFFYWFFIIIRGTFKAPAWMMLPIWFVMELVNARLMETSGAPGGGGVAHWAHVAGFVFGVLAALAIRYFRVEERFIAPKIEARTGFTDKGYALYEDAMAQLEAGNKEAAYTGLLAALAAKPGDPDIVEALWTQAGELNRSMQALPAYRRLMESRIRKGLIPLALQQYDQIKGRFPGETLADAMLLTCADYLMKGQEKNEALSFFHQISPDFLQHAPPGHLITYTSMAVALTPEKADRLVAWLEAEKRVPQTQIDAWKQALEQDKPVSRPTSGHGRI